MCDEPLTPPHGLQAIRQTYGQIVVSGDQVISPIGWEAVHLITVRDLPGYEGRGVRIHRKVEMPLRAALARCKALDDGYKIQSLGCWCVRAKRGGSKELSLHSWAIAVDVNAATNPRGNPMRRDIPDAWVRAFEAEGWSWGGHFQTADPMHFQYASGA